MRLTLLILFVLFTAIIFTSEIAHPDGSPGGYTGSPMDGRNCTECHTGTAIFQAGMITSNIPETGYTPEQTYTITLSLTNQDMLHCGFELTAENILDQKLGLFGNLPEQGTQLLFGGTSVTHDYTGNTPTNGFKSWEVSWTAPIANTGNLTFYAALNAANGEGSWGDQIYTSDLQVKEAQATGFYERQHKQLSIYYSNNDRSVKLSGLGTENSSVLIQILAMNGVPIKTVSGFNTNGSLDVSEITPGIYIVAVYSNNNRYTQKICVE